ncbi:MAG: hypothetical protein K2G45_01155 [Lachnospiraceae bacterium]|nr:hypothetical protein [Lachnospiraceae bacterium]
MGNQQKDKIKLIQKANKAMLDYFNSNFINQLEDIQELKTRMFEIDIKIDELEKTKEIYAFKSNSKKSVFTPVVTVDDNDERGKLIDRQIRDLNEVKTSLDIKISGLDNSLKTLKKRLELLTEAGNAITDLALQVDGSMDSFEDMEENGFQFVKDTSGQSDENHGYNILMLDAFERTFYAGLLEKDVKDGLSNLNHKLDVLSYLVGTDAERAKLTVKEIVGCSDELKDSVDNICKKINSNTESAKPISTLLDDFVMKQRDEHPEAIIDAHIECTDFEMILHPIFTINIFRLLNIFFDNIFMHANGTRIEFTLAVSPHVIDVKIDDNGVGIKPDYLKESPWYSSLHKAYEIVYLLGGKLDISEGAEAGTHVAFSFSVREQS